MKKLIEKSEIVAIIGLISLFIGLYLFRPWIAYTVCGFIVLIIGILTAR